MKSNTTKAVMKCVGATLAVCSAVAMASGSKMMGSNSTKKTMKKTINKVADVVDSISSCF